MKVAGLCSLCGGVANPAYTCRMCGMIVCGKCFDSGSGLCKACVGKTKV